MSNNHKMVGTCLILSGLVALAGCPTAPGVAGSGTNAVTGTDGEVESIDWPAAQVDPTTEDTAGFNQVISADMDGDGLLDLISAASESQPIQLHLQQRSADGTLSFNSFSVAGSGPIVLVSELRVADIDQDGNLDIVIASQDNGFAPANECAEQQCSILILFAPADASAALEWQRFNLTYNHRCELVNETPITFDTIGFDGNARCYSSLDVGDVNQDGFPDILAAFNGCDDDTIPLKQVELWINPGTSAIRTNETLLGSTLIDTDFDGIIDDCTADVSSPWNRVLLQLDILDIAGVRFTDVDLDDDLDVVAVRPDSKTYDVTWQANPLNPSGSVLTEFWGSTGGLHPIGESDTGIDLIEIGDLDGDGLEDVVALTKGDNLVKWFRRPLDPAAQNFPWEVYNMVQFSSLTPTAMEVADVDVNGQIDVLVAAAGRIRWFTPLGQSPYDPWSEVFVADDTTSEINSVHAVDLDDDGRKDIAVTLDRPGVDQDALIWFKNTRDE